MSQDVKNLPKWAQLHIHNLEMKLSLKERELDIALMHQTERCTGNVAIQVGLGIVSYLDDRSTIEFKVSDDKKIRVSLRTDDGCYVDVNGDSTISLNPRAANSVYIR